MTLTCKNLTGWLLPPFGRRVPRPSWSRRWEWQWCPGAQRFACAWGASPAATVAAPLRPVAAPVVEHSARHSLRVHTCRLGFQVFLGIRKYATEVESFPLPISIEVCAFVNWLTDCGRRPPLLYAPLSLDTAPLVPPAHCSSIKILARSHDNALSQDPNWSGTRLEIVLLFVPVCVYSENLYWVCGLKFNSHKTDGISLDLF